ncbi:MAG TPA: DedA family protein [Stellaceae bacterium]|nr:DedA family protein [Stellaceae bacterium]
MHADIGHLVHQYVHDYGYLAVFVGIFLEDFGMPVPGETLLVSAAAFAGQDALNIWMIAGFAWVAAVLGDNIGFLIGHSGGRGLLVRHGRRIGITAERLAKVDRFVKRYGAPVIIFARFVVIARQLNGIAAGSLGMPWWRFLIFNCIGAALWVGFWSTLAYWLGKKIFALTDAFRHATPLAIALAVAAALVIAVYVWWHARHRAGDT